ncbi:MAG TPA: leucine--tRNA ligase [Candidatus Paceibacterota bacterium]|nr:leucine--tRNA ligase [Candidatus Paceibacterota bacterium]
MEKKSKQVKYEHSKLEKKWQAKWRKDKIYETKEGGKKPKAFVLDMFPYPSGEGLHVGHPKGFIATDVYSRFKRMNGFNVLHPMGWDAFGLPAENYALKNKINPEIAVKKNVKHFKEQLEKIGFDYDWSREINTTDPKYYKWTQWIFLQLYKKGLAYQSFEPINWCPSCQTGLANEDLEAGKCERCGSEIEKKPMRQWVLKITDYAERLLADLGALNWPESIKESQRNWIGRSEGAEISFPLKNKYKYVILHGWRSNGQSCFIPWLKKELEAKGHEVIALDLPNPFLPDVIEQAEYVLSKVKFDEYTILVGHSLGSVVSYRILEKLNNPIRKLILVAGLIEPKFRDKERPLAKYLIDWKFDFNKIKKNVQEVVILEDNNDSIIFDGESSVIQQALGGLTYRLDANEPHFCSLTEPKVLEHCLDQIKVFTTRADTLFGATYLVLAPEHPLIKSLSHQINNSKEVEKYIKKASKRSEIERTAESKEKTGVELQGLLAINPADGREIPIWVADYVLPDYGTGAIMAVPAHDIRDHQFAKKFKLPMIQVIEEDLPTKLDHWGEAYAGLGKLINSGTFTDLLSEEAKSGITKMVNGKLVIKYKLRDWVFSRQRYWGEPIPIIHCPKCGVVPVPEKDLPVVLPKVKSYEPTGTGESPLSAIDKWVNVKCPVCHEKAKRETNTMPQWAGSSWYYLRYIDPKNSKKLVDKKKERYWSPVDMYVGGTEHATRHLIYARFWHKFLFDLGVVSQLEPFAQLKNQGMILGSDNRKMSKRWGNVINPDDIVRDFGADTLRVYEMFMGPFEQGASWSTDNLMGARRFVEKIWRLAGKVLVERSRISGSLEKRLLTTESYSGRIEVLLHKTIKQVTADIDNFSYNTAISALMILTNEWEKSEFILETNWKIFLKLVAPFTPHIAEELWSLTGEKGSIHLAKWPKYEESKLKSDTITLVVQINGKTRDSFIAPVDISEKEALEMSLASDKIRKWVGDKVPKKVIYLPNRLLNIVT